MENVSVATRLPFIKTPKDPESTVCPAASLPAPMAAPAISSQSALSTNIALNFKSPLLEFVRFSRSAGVPAGTVDHNAASIESCRRDAGATMQFPDDALLRLRPRPRSCQWFQPVPCRSCNGADGLRTIDGTVPDLAAADARLSPAGTAETIRPPRHPERISALASAPAMQHFQPAQRLRPLTQRHEAKILALRAVREGHLPRRAGIQFLPIHGKSAQCFVLHELGCDHRGLRSPSPS